MAERSRAKDDKATQPSVGQGPTQDQAREAQGASLPQGRRGQPAQNEEEMRERAEFVASSVVESIAPGRAREEAQAASKRASASDPEQALVEEALAEKLTEVADRHDRTVALQSERSKIMNRSGRVPQPGGSASGPLGEPLPDDLALGAPVVYHTPQAQADTTGLVIGVWPKVPDNEDEPDGASHAWRANLVIFPLHGSPATKEGVAHGSGTDQFELADDVDEPKTIAGDEVPFRHEIR